MTLQIPLPIREDKTIYDYTLGELLKLVEEATGKELEDLIFDTDYKISFPNGEKSFIFSND